jgi:hypothetical protein
MREIQFILDTGLSLSAFVRLRFDLDMLVLPLTEIV